MTVERSDTGKERDHHDEQQRIRARCVHPKGGFVPFPVDDAEQSLASRFAHVVRLHGDRVAVQTRQRQLTYAELDAVTSRLARLIQGAAGPGVAAVGLVVGHGLPAVVAMLATIKAGKTSVPLDPRFPGERLSFMIADSQVGLLLTNGPHRVMAARLAGSTLAVIDIDAPGEAGPDQGSTHAIPAHTVAALLYTSGSTGRPKGVPRTHRHLMHHVGVWTNAVHVCPEDRMTLLASGTGQAVGNILFALLNGSTLCPFDVRSDGVLRLARWLIDEEITFYLSSTPLFRQLAGVLAGTERFPHVRVARLASDTVTARDVETYRRIFPDGCVLVNALSLTETGTLTRFLMDKDTALDTPTVPVGYPMPGMDVAVHDARGRPVPPGEVGEIVVASVCIPNGYWRSPELTRERFGRSPSSPDVVVFRTGDLGRLRADGCLEHLGRNDSRVKIRGYRVEPAEVERAILSMDGVSAAAVLAVGETEDRRRLVAYVVQREGPARGVTALRASLANALPDYMVPSSFVLLDALPLTVGGKVDRTVLPMPGRVRPPLAVPPVAPRDEVERRLARIWAEVLELEDVGVEDDFLELGGDSLLATQVMSRAIDAFCIDLPLHVLDDSPTVRAMARAIERVAWESVDREVLERLLATVDPLTDEEVRERLAGRGGEGPDV